MLIDMSFKYFDMVDSIDIGLQFDGSDLFPPLKIGNTLAHG